MTGYPSKRIFFFKIGEQPYGAWHWQRNRNMGIVVRVGPLGHIQLQAYRCKFYGHGEHDGRRGRHGIDLHFWGISGRRSKKGFGFHIYL